MFIHHRRDDQLSELDDNSLIHQYQEQQEHRYFNELYQRYAHLVFGSCLKQVKNRDEAKDLTMIIFEKLVERLPTEQVDNFKTWIYYFTRNECISHLRKQEATTKREEEWKKMRKSEEIFMENETLLRPYTDNSISNIDGAALQHAIQQLSKAQQQCIRRFFFEQQSYKQIATATRWSLKEVKSHLQNGKRKLRLILLEQQQS